MVLEIFEKQNEGVIIFQKSTDAEVPDREAAEAQHETILYTNKAYKKIIGVDHDFESINIPFLTKKPEEGNLMQSHADAERPLYSIRDLLQEPNDLISKTVFSRQRDPQVSSTIKSNPSRMIKSMLH